MPISALRCLPLVAVTVAAVGTTAARAESAMPLLTVIDADDGISIAYDRAALEAIATGDVPHLHHLDRGRARLSRRAPCSIW